MMVHIRAEEPSGKSSGVITGEAAGASKYVRLLSERGALFSFNQSVADEHARLDGGLANLGDFFFSCH